MTKIIWQLPLKTVSEANISEHWTKSSKRHRQQQFFIRQLYMRETSEIPLPCVISMFRLSPYRLDEEDNLRMAFKWIKDEISECIFPEKVGTYIGKSGKLRLVKGRADDSPLIKWQYGQEKSRKNGIRIEISPWIQEPQRDNPL